MLSSSAPLLSVYSTLDSAMDAAITFSLTANSCPLNPLLNRQTTEVQNLLTLWGQEVVVNEKVKAASIAAAIVE